MKKFLLSVQKIDCNSAYKSQLYIESRFYVKILDKLLKYAIFD